jgi:HSP20 family protein
MAKKGKKQEAAKSPAAGSGTRITAGLPRTFADIEEAMDKVMSRYFPGGLLGGAAARWPAWPDLPLPFEGKWPRVDVIDRDKEVLVRAELPGVDRKNVEVTMSDNTVTIKGSEERRKEEKKGEYYRSEISHGAFLRTVTLPAEVDGSKAKAEFKDGILELTVPKAESPKGRKIPVG